MDLYTCGETQTTEVDKGLEWLLRPEIHLSGALPHLKPFVPSEEAEGSHRVTHEEPVDGLLHQIVDGL